MKRRLFFILLLVFSTDSMGARERISSEATTAVYNTCSGNCNTYGFQKVALTKVFVTLSPQEIGLQRTLVDVYGVCKAKNPLRARDIVKPRYTHESIPLVAKEDVVDDREVYVRGFPRGPFDTTRRMNSYAPALGPYVKAAKGGGFCQGTVTVNGQKIKPLHAAKTFGMAGRGVGSNRQFDIYTCLDKKFTEAKRVSTCGVLGPAIVLDCAELIGAAFMNACLKLHPDQKLTKNGIYVGNKGRKELSTHSLLPNPCLLQRDVAPDNPIKGGDIIVIGGHAVMLSNVGDDPFGINDVKSCNNLDTEEFDFSFADSTSTRNIGPVQRTVQAVLEMERQRRNKKRVSDLKEDPFPLDELMIIAQRACKAKKAGVSKVNTKKLTASNAVRILSHNSNNSACKLKDSDCKIATSGCAKQCGLGKGQGKK